MMTPDPSMTLPATMDEAATVATQGEAIIPILQVGIQQGNEHQQCACIRALALIGTPAALQVLGEAALADDQQVREELWTSWQHTTNRGEFGRLVLIPLLGEDESLIIEDEMDPGAVLSLDGLQHCTELRQLDLSGCAAVDDLSPLSGLNQLEGLGLSRCTEIRDLSPLSGLTELSWLGLGGCTGIHDLSLLSELSKMQLLDLNECTGVHDLSPLAHLSELEQLYMKDCTSVHDLAPLSGLSKLRELDMAGCTGVHDLAPLTGLHKLEILDVSEMYLPGVDLRSIRVATIKFCRTHLVGAIGDNAQLKEADFTGANLTDATLTNAVLHKAKLERAILVRASLSGADLTAANLRGADLRGAILENTQLSRANLARADLRDIPWLLVMQLTILHPGIVLTDIRWDQPQQSS